MTSDGQVRSYDWIDEPPTDVNYENTAVHVINMKSTFDPYTIQRISGGNVYKSNNKASGYSAFPSWNHWPVAQFPSDRFDTSHPYRAAHSSATHIQWWRDGVGNVIFGEQGLFQETLLMEGLSDKPAAELLPLAKSWLNAPKAEPGEGVQADYDPAQRAWVLTRESGKVTALKVKLTASKDSPAVNPAFVVPNWGSDTPAAITVNGKQPAASMDVRQGVVRRANGVNALVVWMELTATEPAEVVIGCR